MHIDPAEQKPRDVYKLMTSLVLPRPIAWVTSRNENATLNLAPFSFFNMVSGSPPYMMVSVGTKDSGARKDTYYNVMRTREFVLHMVTEELMHAMNLSGAEFPQGESELSATGLETTASLKIGTPRLAQASVSFECQLHTTLDLDGNTLLIGKVAMFHVADHFIGERFHINGFTPIARMGAPAVYCRTTDRFDLPRVIYEKWLSEQQ